MKALLLVLVLSLRRGILQRWEPRGQEGVGCLWHMGCLLLDSLWTTRCDVGLNQSCRKKVVRVSSSTWDVRRSAFCTASFGCGGQVWAGRRDSGDQLGETSACNGRESEVTWGKDGPGRFGFDDVVEFVLAEGYKGSKERITCTSIQGWVEEVHHLTFTFRHISHFCQVLCSGLLKSFSHSFLQTVFAGGVWMLSIPPFHRHRPYYSLPKWPNTLGPGLGRWEAWS